MWCINGHFKRTFYHECMFKIKFNTLVVDTVLLVAIVVMNLIVSDNPYCRVGQYAFS